MKGLKEYIAKHGFHFTVELAYKAGGKKWTSEQVMSAAQKKVYYNVTGSTVGDITYRVNALSGIRPKNKCIDITLAQVGCFSYFGYGGIFSQWFESMQRMGKDFDFTPFI